MMNPEFKTQWLIELRSDNYRQTSGKMRRWTETDINDNQVYSYCCLGVLAIVVGGVEFKPALEFNEHSLPADYSEYAKCTQNNLTTAGRAHFGLSEYDTGILVAMNDGQEHVENPSARKWTFKEIANWIEHHL